MPSACDLHTNRRRALLVAGTAASEMIQEDAERYLEELQAMQQLLPAWAAGQLTHGAPALPPAGNVGQLLQRADLPRLLLTAKAVVESTAVAMEVEGWPNWVVHPLATLLPKVR